MKKKKLLGTLLVSAILLGACTTGGTSKTDDSAKTGTGEAEQVFNLAVLQEMPTADLSIATDTISFTALNNVYEGLYRLDNENKPQPAAAAELAEVSEDGLTYKLKLREDAKWSNGDPVTAADFVYGWQRTVDPETGSQYAYLYEVVDNATDIINGKKPATDLGIKAVGDYELEITLAVATPYFDYLLAFPSFFPQHEATVEEFGADYAKKSDTAVYNGPFTLSDFDGPGVDTEWSYEKNPEYWDVENVKLETINVSVVKESSTGLNLFQDGQLDDVILTGELAQQNANSPEFVTLKESRTSYIEMNQREKDSPFNNENLRKALSYSIDREALVKQVLGDGSEVATGLIPQNMSFNPDTGKDFVEETTNKTEYDVEKAKEYWEKAKQELGIDSLSFELLSDDTDSVKKAAEYVQGVWNETLDGVDVSMTNVPFSVRLDRSNAGDFEVVFSGWGADYADPSSFIDLFVTGNAYNRGRWSNEDYDKVVKDAATTYATQPAERWQALLDAENILIEDMGTIPVYQRAEAHLRAEKVKNIVSHGAGASHDYKWAYIEE